MSENNTFNDIVETPEELLWPPKIDIMGVLMMSLVALIVGGIISVGVLLASFFSIGNFSVASGVSPFILAMTTFFILTLAISLYLALARIIFPAIYTRNRESFRQLMIFMIVLYFCVLPAYLMLGSNISTGKSSVLLAYLFHIILAVFGMEIILGSISQYRYILLSFYANLIAIVLTGGIVLGIFRSVSASEVSMFLLMGLSILTFFLSTTLIFLVKFLYYKFYSLTGNDPLGSLFYGIELSERQKVEHAKNTLLQ